MAIASPHLSPQFSMLLRTLFHGGISDSMSGAGYQIFEQSIDEFQGTFRFIIVAPMSKAKTSSPPVNDAVDQGVSSRLRSSKTKLSTAIKKEEAVDHHKPSSLQGKQKVQHPKPHPTCFRQRQLEQDAGAARYLGLMRYMGLSPYF